MQDKYLDFAWELTEEMNHQEFALLYFGFMAHQQLLVI